MNIYDVKVCKFVSIEKKENYESVCCLKRSELETHYCVIDFIHMLATDIYTGEQFSVLQKNMAGQILASEKVELGKNYALYFEYLNLNKLSIRELLKVKLACLRMTLLEKFSGKRSISQKQNVIKR